MLLTSIEGGDQGGCYISCAAQESPSQGRVIRPQMLIVLLLRNCLSDFVCVFVCVCECVCVCVCFKEMRVECDCREDKVII